MRKAYVKPQVEVEVYSLSASIAANCTNIVNPGPGIGGHTECVGYVGPWMSGQQIVTYSAYNVSFWEDTCDCYYTSGGEGFWTS